MWWLIDGQQCAKINILYDFESKCQKKGVETGFNYRWLVVFY